MRYDRAGSIAAMVVSFLASSAVAQDLMEAERAAEDRDWMSAGLGPLILLLAVGLVIALFAAGAAAIATQLWRHREGGAREA